MWTETTFNLTRREIRTNRPSNAAQKIGSSLNQKLITLVESALG
jgi:hypothetical protein